MREKLQKLKVKGKRAGKLPFVLVPLVTFGLLLAISGSVYFLARTTDKLPKPHDAKVVIISHDHEKQIVPTKEATVGQLLDKLNIELNEGDVVEPARSTHIRQDQFRINIYRAVPVEVVDGGTKTFAFSAATTPRAIARQAGVKLYPEDLVNTDPVQNFLKEGSIGEQVVIDRATVVNVDMYGTPIVLRTHAKTVAGLMKEKNIKLSGSDRLSIPANTPITPGMQVGFIRTGTKVETVTEEIAMPVQKINDPSLAYGTTAVRQQGAPGQQTVTYEIAITNNVETGRRVIQKVVNKDPVLQIEVRGTNLAGIKGDMALAGIGPDEYAAADFVISHESGWNPASMSSNGCAGLGQACPASKLANACPNWQNDPVCQLRFFTGYASRYGGWNGAKAAWQRQGWW
jgi:uncharacterized protein YabE (DUF348 family)